MNTVALKLNFSFTSVGLDLNWKTQPWRTLPKYFSIINIIMALSVRMYTPTIYKKNMVQFKVHEFSVALAYINIYEHSTN